MEAKTLYDTYVAESKKSDKAGMDYINSLSLKDYKNLVESLEVLWMASYLKLEVGNGKQKPERALA